jgi:sarcosine oxidase
MTEVYDVAVVGAGAMGSAAAWALTKAGRSVVVFEQFELGHDRGGSHGATRIFRLGTEQAHYLELAQRARTLWSQLEDESGAHLLTITGAVEHGMDTATAEDFGRMLHAHGVEHDVLAAEAASQRWRGMRFAGAAVFQPGGGILHADAAVSALQELASRQGAAVRSGVRIDKLVTAGSDEVAVVDSGGESTRAKRVVVAAGSWAPKLLAGVIDLPAVTVTQEQPRVFEMLDTRQDWPCFVQWRDHGGEWGCFEGYGLREGDGVKVGLHASGPQVDPDSRDFAPEPRRDEALRTYVREWFPGLDPDGSSAISCLYDNTANKSFVIDRVGPISIATGFNGEGFKFVPVIGEILRDLALDEGRPPEMFTIDRHLRGRS